MITLALGGTSVTLNDDLLWSDEFSWTPVQQTVDKTITGAQIVQVGALVSGREITLQPADNDSGATSGAVLLQLRTWAAIAGQVLQLTIRSVTRDVIFRHQDRALEVQKWIHYADLDDADKYFVTMRFMEVET